VTTLANLPVCVDEITHMPHREAADLAMGITQPGHRLRLDQNGVERSATGGHKATIMLTTANSSLHTLLATDNAAGTAGSMRVVEIPFRAMAIHQKYEADDYLGALREHYGHIGEAFIQYVMPRQAEIEARIRAKMKHIDHVARVQASERFWSATIATVLVTAEIGETLGVLPFSSTVLERWAITEQLPGMRGVVGEQYATSGGLLGEYLEEINADILVTRRMSGNLGLSTVVKAPRGALHAHYDLDMKQLIVLKKSFRDYCVQHGANYLKILDELSAPSTGASGKGERVIPFTKARRTLGAGTEFAKAQTWCFIINMTHPEITGAASLVLATTAPVLPLRSTG
jgi:hypothetical protein